MTSAASLRATARVDLDAVRDNVARLGEIAGSAQVLAVVKADAYGHGIVQCAQAARGGGATWLGVALFEEALRLREAGDQGRLLAWLAVPGDPWAACLEADIEVSVNAAWAVAEVVAAAQETGQVARVHLGVDTGLSREGAAPSGWPEFFSAVAVAAAEGHIDVVGMWSQLAFGEVAGHPTTARQREVFDAAYAAAVRHGVRPQVRHLANSGATLTDPRTHYDLVRVGIAAYGLSPDPHLIDVRSHGLRPAMRLSAELALVKDVPAGEGISYNHTYTTPAATTLGLVPLGYADGIPRHASNGGPVRVAGRDRRISGRVCMDQFVVDLDGVSASAGDEVVLFGDPAAGEPSADDWATASGTIAYEITTRLGPRIAKVYSGIDAGSADDGD